MIGRMRNGGRLAQDDPVRWPRRHRRQGGCTPKFWALCHTLRRTRRSKSRRAMAKLIVLGRKAGQKVMELTTEQPEAPAVDPAPAKRIRKPTAEPATA